MLELAILELFPEENGKQPSSISRDLKMVLGDRPDRPYLSEELRSPF